MQLQHLLIQINGSPIQIGEQLPNQISSLTIEYQAIIPMQIPKHQYLAVVNWFNTLRSNLTCEYVNFNGTLIPTSDLKEVTT